MSTVFQIVCQTCEMKGPKIRRTVGLRAVLHAAEMPATAEGKKAGEKDWGEFLYEHEFHDLHLETGP